MNMIIIMTLFSTFGIGFQQDRLSKELETINSEFLKIPKNAKKNERPIEKIKTENLTDLEEKYFDKVSSRKAAPKLQNSKKKRVRTR